jgi:polysaccharide biosynthesis/export protein
MNYLKYLLAVSFLVCFFGGQFCASAQDDNAKLATRTSLIIGPDDGLSINVLDSDELSKTWRVSGTGDLTLPMIGKIHAAGLTADQLEVELTESLKQYIRDPQVTVYISEFRSQPVTVAGGVDKPGTFQTEGPKTLITVLMMAGGLKSPGPDITVTRDLKYGPIPLPEAHTDAAGHYSTVDLKVKDVLDASSPAANLIIRPNDVISVSTDQRLVYIIGQVTKPGSVELVTRDSVSLMEVLAAAGGLTNIAAPGSTAILRLSSQGLYQKVGSVDLKKVMTGQIEDRILSAGDIVVVPSSNLKIYSQAATASVITTGLYILARF